jgi:vitamin B12 transporter
MTRRTQLGMAALLSVLAPVVLWAVKVAGQPQELPEPVVSWAPAPPNATMPPAPPRPPEAGELDVYGCCAVTGPRRIRDVAPVYPDAAIEAAVQGTVALELLVDTRGKVASVRVVKGIPGLDDAARAAALGWRYEPARLRGKAIATLLPAEITFTLPGVR